MKKQTKTKTKQNKRRKVSKICKTAENNYSSTMSNFLWYDFKRKVVCLKYMTCFLILSMNVKNKLTLHQININLKEKDLKTQWKTFQGRQKPWDFSLKPEVNIPGPAIGMVIGAKSKNAPVGQATTKIVRSISGGNVSPKNDM